MQQDITIVINSCDTYSDLWDPFFALLKKNWPECPYRIILNTEQRKYNFDGLNIDVYNIESRLRNKSIGYGKRFKNVLKHIDTEYVLIMLDDFFIRSEVNTEEIQSCKKWMESDDKIALISFESVDDSLNIAAENHPGFVLRPEYGDYKINLQAGLWRRSRLINLIRDGESPWDFELLGNMRTFGSGDKFYALASKKKRIINYRKNNGVFPYKWSVVGGKWVVDTVDSLFRENGIEIDYNIRGIYTDDDYKRDQTTLSVQYSPCKLIKSLGIGLYVRIYKWGYICKLARLFLRKKLPGSYIEYKRKHYKPGAHF